eukprot:2170720-Heterocapsa_arctica.AAC.1
MHPLWTGRKLEPQDGMQKLLPAAPLADTESEGEMQINKRWGQEDTEHMAYKTEMAKLQTAKKARSSLD